MWIAHPIILPLNSMNGDDDTGTDPSTTGIRLFTEAKGDMMTDKKPEYLGELKKQISRLPNVREEMRKNLIRKLEKKERLFPAMIGYDETVMPGLINAILCGHNIIFLGERGQGKSRLIRGMTDFLDDEIP